jgi:hypothetical protein
MMQSCASAAKLRGGGPILNRGSKTIVLSGGRHLGSSSAGQGQSDTDRPKLSQEGLRASCQAVERRSRPAGASPVVARRQSTMRSLRASATTMVLRVPPRASAVRLRYHSANGLPF